MYLNLEEQTRKVLATLPQERLRSFGIGEKTDYPSGGRPALHGHPRADPTDRSEALRKLRNPSRVRSLEAFVRTEGERLRPATRTRSV